MLFAKKQLFQKQSFVLINPRKNINPDNVCLLTILPHKVLPIRRDSSQRPQGT